MRRSTWELLKVGTFGAAFVTCVTLSYSTNAQADEQNLDEASVPVDDESSSDSRIERGFAIAPVPLNLRGKNRALVGLGSYLVNAVGGCNDCHTDPSYAIGGDPYLGQPKKVNVARYLAGGRQFGAITARNLTPDKTGRPEGGNTFAEFLQIIRRGTDLDLAHPEISPLLQVMPWPVYQDMTDNDLRAIYEYLSTIPCIEGDPGIPGAPTSGRCK